MRVFERKTGMNMKITWKEFRTDNKILLWITLCSVLIIVKNSSAPFILGMEKLFSWLLNRPEDGTVWGEVFAVLENLSLAYLMSFIFYVLTCYIPERKRELRAQFVISGKLSKMYEGLDKLLTSVLFEVGVYSKSTTEIAEITENVLCSIKEYAISDENKYQAMGSIFLAKKIYAGSTH